MRLVAVLGTLVWLLTACTPSAGAPTPLPTAVPPSGDGIGNWATGFRYEFPTGSFGEGKHRYRFLVHCPVAGSQDINTDWHYFEITGNAPLSLGPVYLRLAGLSAEPLASLAPAAEALHPDQQIVAVMHWVDVPLASADLIASQCETLILWDNTGRQSLIAGTPFQQ